MSWISSIYDYFFPSEYDIPMGSGTRITYVTKTEFKLIKPKSSNYFMICENESWLAEKTIPQSTNFRIVKFIKMVSTGQIRVIARFDQNIELIDVSEAFVSVYPLIPDSTYALPIY